MSCDLKKLIHPSRVYHTNQLCLLAQDYLRHRYCLPNRPSQNCVCRQKCAAKPAKLSIDSVEIEHGFRTG